MPLLVENKLKRFVVNKLIYSSFTMADIDIRLKTPFTMTIAGGTQSGKSTLTAKIIKRRMEIMDPPIGTSFNFTNQICDYMCIFRRITRLNV